MPKVSSNQEKCRKSLGKEVLSKQLQEPKSCWVAQVIGTLSGLSVHWMELQLWGSFSRNIFQSEYIVYLTFHKFQKELKKFFNKSYIGFKEFILKTNLFIFWKFSSLSNQKCSGSDQVNHNSLPFLASMLECEFRNLTFFKALILMHMVHIVYMVKHQRYLSAMNMHCSITQAALLPKCYRNSIFDNQNMQMLDIKVWRKSFHLKFL